METIINCTFYHVDLKKLYKSLYNQLFFIQLIILVSLNAANI